MSSTGATFSIKMGGTRAYTSKKHVNTIDILS
jgi:hypothetical protein